MEANWIIQTVVCSIVFGTAGSDSCSLSVTDQLGPYFLYNAPWKSKVCDETDPQFNNDKLKVSGYVIGRNCKGVADATVDIWQAGSDGTYDPNESFNSNAYPSIQYDYMSNDGTKDYKCRARVQTDSTGSFSFETVMPGFYNPRPLHLHYRVSSKDKTSVHQMYFDGDFRGGKISSLTVKTDQSIANLKIAVFNFTIDTDGNYEFGSKTPNDTGTNITDTNNGGKEKGEEENTCYSCSPCPDPFKASNNLVSITQCPPHGCRTWRNLNSKTWNRGCFLTSECQPEDAAYKAICCKGDNCNAEVNAAPGIKCNIVIVLVMSFIIYYLGKFSR